jgi:4-hydroxybenzoate polyprenyltransferase
MGSGEPAFPSFWQAPTMNTRAYLQLARAPNVFTAMADVLLGFLFTHENLEPWPQFVLLLAASSLLYLAGIVLNDYFDREQDARERPFRPIPSGRVSAARAGRLGWAMLAFGIALAWATSGLAADIRPAVVATLLAAMVVAYDMALKRTYVGPVAMGACRTLNVLLGMSTAPQSWSAVHGALAAGIGLYIAGVTVFARSEARQSGRPQLALGLGVLLAGLALVASLPAWIHGDEWPGVAVPPRWFLFWALLAMLVGWRCVRAIRDPAPATVQSAVRNCIFSLVIIDAGACLAVHDLYWASLILLLLLPTMTLGRWIYST